MDERVGKRLGLRIDCEEMSMLPNSENSGEDVPILGFRNFSVSAH